MAQDCAEDQCQSCKLISETPSPQPIITKNTELKGTAMSLSLLLSSRFGFMYLFIYQALRYDKQNEKHEMRKKAHKILFISLINHDWSISPTLSQFKVE